MSESDIRDQKKPIGRRKPEDRRDALADATPESPKMVDVMGKKQGKDGESPRRRGTIPRRGSR